ncbi:MAG: hypothetical protein M3Y72_03165 [Acidobacteriota bacterium]|nr:hypothetical protein [Acidobacteriota bacterium]
MKLFALLWKLLRELSDEAGYARHLRMSGRKHSAAEWKQFTNHRYRRKYQNAKCC